MAGNDVVVPIEDPTTELLTYQTIRLFRDTQPDGTFSTHIATAETALDADTFEYTLNDPNGTSQHWYRWKLYNSTGPVQSELSAASRPAEIRAYDYAIEAIKMAGGFEGVCSADGGSNTLIDEVLRDNSTENDYLQGLWTFRPTASGNDIQHRSADNPFDPSQGAVTYIRDWDTPPVSGERYAMTGLLPVLASGRGGYSWMDAVREGINDIQFEDEILVGVGDSIGTARFSLSGKSGYVEQSQVRAVFTRMTDANGIPHDTDWSKELRYWSLPNNGRGGLSVALYPAPPLDAEVFIVSNRRYDPVYAIDDISDCPLRLGAAAALVKAYEYLNRRDGGNRWVAELAGAMATYWAQVPWTVATDEIIGL